MADLRPSDRRGEWNNKLSVARMAAFGTIMAAGVSAAVSYFVSNKTIQLEQKRISVEESLERAKIFRELVDAVRTSDDPTYALLALWKVYPQDERLIVTTALMNPTPNTVSTLHAFGIAERLDEYNETIRNMMINAPRDRRKEFSITYRDISPETVLAVNVEAVIRSGGDESDLFDLRNLIGFRPDLQRPLSEIIETDSRVQSEPLLRLRLARTVYDSNPAHWAAVLQAAKEDDRLFQLVARETINHLKLFSAADQDELMERTVSALERMSQDEELQGQIGDVIRLFSGLTRILDPSAAQRQRFSDAVAPVYRRKARAGRPDPQILIAISRFARGGVASDLFLETLVCAPEDRAEMFYASFPAQDLALSDWDEDMSFAAGKSEAQRRIQADGEGCARW